MGAMARRMQVLVALAVGCAFGSAATGCAFVWMGVARADDAVTVDCVSTVTQSVTVTHDFGTSDPADLARVSAILVRATPATAPRAAVPVGVSFLGSVASASCKPGETVTFVMR